MKKIIIGLVLAALVGGGAYFAVNNSSKDDAKTSSITPAATTATKSNTETSGSNEYNTSIKNIVAMGKSVKCTFMFADGTTTTDGTTYFASDKRVRIDFKNIGGESNFDGSMLLNANKQYVWDQTKKIGTVFDVSDVAKTQNKGISSDKVIDFKCNNWTPSEAILTPPADVNFLSL